MFKNLEIFRTANAMAGHAAARQNVIAANVAHADTPGYKARDVTPFEKMVGSDRAVGMKITRETHIAPINTPKIATTRIDHSSEPSPNGNSVSIETEMLKSIEAERQHSRAISIYKSSLNILRTSIGR